MNNIKKIIEERLENAQIDLKCNINLSVEDVRVLQGQIEAYQDCLNLMQPRTEQDILKDFEKLGYEVFNSHNHPFIEMNKYNEQYSINEFIIINLGDRSYEKYLSGGEAIDITMQEHKLLNELFEVWQWN